MNIIFFDGYCGLCNGFVDFILKVDQREMFKFSPLQSDFAQEHLSPRDVQNLTSVVVLIDGKSYRKAAGVIKALSALGGKWKLISALGILPESVLNQGYDLVAKNRYKLFDKKETCRVPTAQERSRFMT